MPIEGIKQRLAVCTSCGANTMLFDEEERCMMCGRAMKPPIPDTYIKPKSRYSHPRYSTAPRKRGRPRNDSYINTAPLIDPAEIINLATYRLFD